MRIILLMIVILNALQVNIFAQGTVTINPVPVTNGVTGTLGSPTILAALYYGPAGASENSLLMLGAPSALVNGYAQFSSQAAIPAFPSGTLVKIQVRAWSLGYPSYETAVASGLNSILAGKSIIAAATLGGSTMPPPVPNPLSISGFTVYPVPEVATPVLLLTGLGVLIVQNCKGKSANLKS
jgi:hypothetical protein